MDHRRLFALGASALALVLPATGCGDYADPPDGSSGGAGAGGTATAGTSGTAGTAGTAAGASGTAGTATSGGTGGTTAGTAGTAGSGQAGGGAAGTAGTAEAGGTAGTAGTAGSAGDAGTAGTGGGAPVACPDPVPTTAPCGGDVNGAWTVASCELAITGELNMTGFGLGCNSATVTSGKLEVTGTITFNPDGTYADNTVAVGEQLVELPETCLHVSGTVTACDRVGGPVRDSLGYVNFDCVDNATTGGCSCEATIEQEGGLGLISLDPFTEGSFMAMGTSVTLEGQDEDTEYAYCVEGNTMTASLVTPGKIGTLMGPFVLQK